MWWRGGAKVFWLSIAVLVVGALEPGQSIAQSTTRPSNLNLPNPTHRYTLTDLPFYFRSPAMRRIDNTPPDNPITDAGATLGRVLFYDMRLSGNNSVSCATCHVQKNAFSSPQRFDIGFHGQATDRHSMSLVNVRYYERGRFFRDERANTLEQQVLMPISSPSEMGRSMQQLIEILSRDADYPGLFFQAFGEQTVTADRMSRAMAQFIRSMVSYQSKYDQGRINAQGPQADFANFTPQENHGKALFLNNCAVCHQQPGTEGAFIMNFPRNNGIDADLRVVDAGLGDVSLNPAEVGLFKSVSMRNIAVAGPYMHDGRLATLEQVVDFYNTQFRQHPNLSRGMRRFGFNDQDKSDLVAFLKTLTDEKFLADPRFSDPFVVHPGAQTVPPARGPEHVLSLRTQGSAANIGPGGGRGPRGRGPGQGPGRGGRDGRGRGRGGPGFSMENVIDRVLSFDPTFSGGVTVDHLPERMDRLVDVGDSNRDGKLDRVELRSLAGQAP